MTEIFKLLGVVTRFDGSSVQLAYRLKDFSDAGLAPDSESKLIMKILDDDNSTGMLSNIRPDHWIEADVWLDGEQFDLRISAYSPYQNIWTRH